jgi:hypothetical protein
MRKKDKSQGQSKHEPKQDLAMLEQQKEESSKSLLDKHTARLRALISIPEIPEEELEEFLAPWTGTSFKMYLKPNSNSSPDEARESSAEFRAKAKAEPKAKPKNPKPGK